MYTSEVDQHSLKLCGSVEHDLAVLVAVLLQSQFGEHEVLVAVDLAAKVTGDFYETASAALEESVFSQLTSSYVEVACNANRRFHNEKTTCRNATDYESNVGRVGVE